MRGTCGVCFANILPMTSLQGGAGTAASGGNQLFPATISRMLSSRLALLRTQAAGQLHADLSVVCSIVALRPSNKFQSRGFLVTRSTRRQSSTIGADRPTARPEVTRPETRRPLLRGVPTWANEECIKRPKQTSEVEEKKTSANQVTTAKKTQADLDAELREKMESIAGDGGASGVEYEDGRPVAMKRSVRENMFRYI